MTFLSKELPFTSLKMDFLILFLLCLTVQLGIIPSPLWNAYIVAVRVEGLTSQIFILVSPPQKRNCARFHVNLPKTRYHLWASYVTLTKRSNNFSMFQRSKAFRKLKKSYHYDLSSLFSSLFMSAQQFVKKISNN